MRKCVAIVSFWALTAEASTVGYAQSSDYFQKGKRPSLYQPLHLLDGRQKTAWCTESVDPLNQFLTIGFKQSTRIDEIRIWTGNGFNSNTFDQFARAKKVQIRSDSGMRVFSVRDENEWQSISFEPPLTGAHFFIDILDSHPGSDIEAPVCVSDVIFYSNGKPLNGEWLRSKLRFNRRQAPILGTWFGGYAGAPDRLLSFYFDGTYRYDYSPFDTSKHKPEAFRGRYRVTAERIVLETGPNRKMVATFRTSKKGNQQVLILEGKLPPGLSDEFRDVP